MSFLRPDARAAAARALLLVAGLAACGEILGIDDVSEVTAPTGTGTATDTGLGGDGGGGAGGETGTETDTETQSGEVIYVSTTTGDDLADGLTPRTAKATIANGLATATDRSVGEVRVCAGTYAEGPLLLEVPVSLMGGYDCDSWERAEGYGYPTFDPIHETVIETSRRAAGTATLVLGGVLEHETSVDGFTIRGPASIPDMSPDLGTALVISSSPTVTNCRVVGGSSTSPVNVGSAGVVVLGGAEPEITQNSIDGGTGTSTQPASVGSVGLLIADGSPAIHDNVITGGDGTGLQYGSVGIYVGGGVLREMRGSALADNAIDGGIGFSGVIDSVGVLVSGATGAELDLLDNVILGRSELEPPPAGARGVVISNTTAPRVARNRIYAGVSPAASQAGASMVGAAFTTTTGLVFEANMVHGGGGPTIGAAGIAWRAISVAGDTDPLFRHNTIQIAPVTGAIGIFSNPASPPVRMAIDNNIVFGTGTASYPIGLGSCPATATLKSLQGNVVFGIADGTVVRFDFTDANCGAPASFTSFSTAEAAIESGCNALTLPCGSFGGANVGSNIQLSNSCSATDCVQLPQCGNTSTLCAAEIFEVWGALDSGKAALFTPGWRLRELAPCEITTGAILFTAATDIFGMSRTPPPSMGAHEFDGACL